MSKSIKLLLIEDNEIDQQAFLRMVKEKKLLWEVQVADTLKRARQQLVNTLFDVIVADYHLPDGDSTELFDELYSLPFILITGTLNEQLALRTLQRGADDYLPKDPQQGHLDAVPFVVEKALYRKQIHDRERLLTDELRKSEEHFRTLVEASSDVLYRMSPDWSEMWQLTSSGFLKNLRQPSQDWLKEYILPDDQSQVRAVINHAIKDKSIFQLEHRVRRPDGRIGWTFSRAVPLLNANGEILEWFGAATDITDRRQAEEACKNANHMLQELTANLERRVVERTQELEEKAERLRFLSKQLTELEEGERRRLAEILHDELQQYLVAARIRLDVIERNINKKVTDLDRKHINDLRNFINEAVQSARSLVGELRPPVLYEGGFLAALDFLIRKSWEKYNLKVHFSKSSYSEPSSDFIKVLLYRSIEEIILNIVKHSGNNECFVDLKNNDYNEVCVNIRDEGKGFDPAVIGKRESTGMGLFSIHERILAIGGRFEVKSSPGKGSIFNICVPAHIEIAEGGVEIKKEHQGESISANKDKGGLIVLLVDDHRIVRQSMSAMFKNQEFIKEVIEAEDGEDAVNKSLLYNPDIIIMDLNMPKMNGIQATKTILQSKPDAKIIGLSVQDERQASQAMKDAGAMAYFNKGEDMSSLLETIKRLTYS
jgi:signal transduction histidine kinase/DNA-binding NarL/FixJ family response regulator